MILGTVTVTDDAVITHRDSYLLGSLTVVSVRRPILIPSLMVGLSGAAFGVAFSDLLFISEIAATAIIASGAIFLGIQLGQLKLVSRDLKNTELSSAVWGQYHDLQHHRHAIVEGVRNSKKHSLNSPIADGEISS